MNETKNPPIVIISNIRKLLRYPTNEDLYGYIEAYLRWEHGESLDPDGEYFVITGYQGYLTKALYFLEHGETIPRAQPNYDFSPETAIGKYGGSAY